jgi:toxin FitB
MTILDTNVLSEIMATSPSESALAWVSNRRLVDPLFTTTISMAEILYGVELLPSGKRRDRLKTEAQAIFAEDFSWHILVFDEAAARCFSRIAAERRRQGKPIAELDAQIAAIALVHDASLATRNTSDFEGCGLQLINPWLD